MQESRDKQGWKTNAHISQTPEHCWLSARGYSRCALCPASLALAALHTAFLAQVHSRDNDLVPLLKGPQVPTGKPKGCRFPKGQIQCFTFLNSLYSGSIHLLPPTPTTFPAYQFRETGQYPWGWEAPSHSPIWKESITGKAVPINPDSANKVVVGPISLPSGEQRDPGNLCQS